jgi:predicted nuclease of predicted toxin-antitoxin system
LIRLLLDQGLPRSTVRVLADAGWDVLHVGDIGMARSSDSEILNHARHEQRVCVTLDADFHSQLAVSAAAGALRQFAFGSKA